VRKDLNIPQIVGMPFGAGLVPVDQAQLRGHAFSRSAYAAVAPTNTVPTREISARL